VATKGQIDSLKSKDQRYRAKRYEAMYISRTMLESKVWGKLSKVSMRVYLLFLTKRIMEKVQTRAGKADKDYFIANNGQIQFSFREAVAKWGIPRSCFTRAISQLVGLGFIDIAKAGSGLHRDVTLYAISERWKLYGTDEFVAMKRPKRNLHYGFQKGHKRFFQHPLCVLEGDGSSTDLRT